MHVLNIFNCYGVCDCVRFQNCKRNFLKIVTFAIWIVFLRKNLQFCRYLNSVKCILRRNSSCIHNPYMLPTYLFPLHMTHMIWNPLTKPINLIDQSAKSVKNSISSYFFLILMMSLDVTNVIFYKPMDFSQACWYIISFNDYYLR